MFPPWLREGEDAVSRHRVNVVEPDVVALRLGQGDGTAVKVYSGAVGPDRAAAVDVITEDDVSDGCRLLHLGRWIENVTV